MNGKTAPEDSRSPDQLDGDLRRYREQVEDPSAGFFGPGSMFWKVGRENILALPGPAAILLQLAHPLVAAGVDDHSSFREDPVGRLHGTFRFVHRVTFGSADRAVEAAQTVRNMHDRVHGELEETVGSFPAGTTYHANRPDLLMWVHATLVDRAIAGYEKLVGPLSRAEKEGYYRESRTFGRLFGVPDAVLPDDLGAFYEYYRATVEEVLAVGPVARRLQRELFYARWLAMPAQHFLAGGFLPERVRRLYGLRWSPVLERSFDAFCGAARMFLPIIPSVGRYVRTYRTRRAELMNG